MSSARYPSLYQINTRVWLTELPWKLGRTAMLDDIPDAELDRMAEKGFDSYKHLQRRNHETVICADLIAAVKTVHHC